MKIAFFETQEWEEEKLRQAFPGEKLLFFKEPLKKEHREKIGDCEALCVFIYSEISKEVLENLPRLQLITTRSTGYDHIDLEAAKSKDIIVCNVPSYGENTVAE